MTGTVPSRRQACAADTTGTGVLDAEAVGTRGRWGFSGGYTLSLHFPCSTSVLLKMFYEIGISGSTVPIRPIRSAWKQIPSRLPGLW